MALNFNRTDTEVPEEVVGLLRPCRRRYHCRPCDEWFREERLLEAHAARAHPPEPEARAALPELEDDSDSAPRRTAASGDTRGVSRFAVFKVKCLRRSLTEVVRGGPLFRLMFGDSRGASLMRRLPR